MNWKGKIVWIHWFNTLMFTSEMMTYPTDVKSMKILKIFRGMMYKSSGNLLLLLIPNTGNFEKYYLNQQI